MIENCSLGFQLWVCLVHKGLICMPVGRTCRAMARATIRLPTGNWQQVTANWAYLAPKVSSIIGKH